MKAKGAKGDDTEDTEDKLALFAPSFQGRRKFGPLRSMITVTVCLLLTHWS